jgi:quercetin dioxygenase-like cupin family protein
MASKPYINVDYFEDLTGDIAPTAAAAGEAIGQRIRTVRKQKEFSLDQLSQLTGFDVDLLAGIEANRVQPQLGTLIKLSKALDSAFGRILSGAGGKPYAVTRKGQRMEISRSTSRKGTRNAYTYISLAPQVKGRHMEALLIQLETAQEPEKSSHQGEEFIFVLSGTVQLIVGTDRFDLEPGDSAYYLSTTPHFFTAKEERATILAVIYEG